MPPREPNHCTNPRREKKELRNGKQERTERKERTRKIENEPRTTIQLVTNIDLLRSPARPPFFSLSTLTLRHYPLRTAERARMPETALLFFFFFQNSRLKKSSWGGVEFFASPTVLNSCFLGIPHATWTPPLLVSCGTVQLLFDSSFPFFCTSSCTKLSSYQKRFHPDDLRLAHHISSAPSTSAQQQH